MTDSSIITEMEMVAPIPAFLEFGTKANSVVMSYGLYTLSSILLVKYCVKFVLLTLAF